MVHPRIDAVDGAVKNLKLEEPLPKQVVDATKDALRLLNFKNPIKSLGGKYDNERKRACVILEYIAREQGGITIPMHRLAKAACINVKDFVAFHELVGNFRENTTMTKSKSSMLSNVSSSVSLSGTTNPSQAGKISKKQNIPCVSAITIQKSSIPSLAIQMGAFMTNSNSVSLKAQKLFQTIIKFLQRKKNRQSVSGLEDITKNQPCYEAACFYLIATKESSNLAQSKRISFGSKNLEDDDYDNQLDLSTFLNLIQGFTKARFQMILEYVTELCDEIKNVTQSMANPTKDDLSNIIVPSRNNISSNSDNTARKRRLSGGASKTLIDRASAPTCRNIDNTMEVIMDLAEQEDFKIKKAKWLEKTDKYSPTFLEWKKRVVSAACDDAKKQMMDDQHLANRNNKTKESTEIDSDNALDYAVNKILQSRVFVGRETCR